MPSSGSHLPNVFLYNLFQTNYFQSLADAAISFRFLFSFLKLFIFSLWRMLQLRFGTQTREYHERVGKHDFEEVNLEINFSFS